jgi:hypothetical protein
VVNNPTPLILALQNNAIVSNAVKLEYDGTQYYWATLFKVTVTGQQSVFTDFTLQADMLGMNVESTDIDNAIDVQLYMTTQPCSLSSVGQPGYPLFVATNTFGLSVNQRGTDSGMQVNGQPVFSRLGWKDKRNHSTYSGLLSLRPIPRRRWLQSTSEWVTPL